MTIRNVRRLSQAFFLGLFLWLCLASTLGEAWWRLRGWPVNWFLQLDPLVALATLLAGGALFAGLLWALLTMALTILLGRFFCGWVCPLGALNQFIGWLGGRGRRLKERAARNQPHPAQKLKYYILVFLLAAAAGDLLGRAGQAGGGVWWLIALGLSALAALAIWQAAEASPRARWGAALLAGGWLVLAWALNGGEVVGGSVLSGLLDPLPLLQRSVSLAVLPALDGQGHILGAPRHYDGAWLIAALLAAALGLNLWRPRFYCRFVCPLGALLGLLSRWSWWRIARREAACRECLACEASCEGACAPSGRLRWSECVLCLNCFQTCGDDLMTYRAEPSAAGESAAPDLVRRGLGWSLLSGAAAVPFLRLGGGLARDWPPQAVRPPGALDESRFLARCVRCGQCMRICPSGVIQPAALQAGLEGLWTPVLNFRIGNGGCLLNCVACGHLCPTAAIRPLSLDEKLGRGAHAGQGPVRIGTAFLDRGRCLPWAMDRPCIVCQENCPVSPKAIHTRLEYRPLRVGERAVSRVEGRKVALSGPAMKPGALASGDYFLRVEGQRLRIAANGNHEVELASAEGPAAWREGQAAWLEVRLQLPYVDLAACIGCGACQHECPVSGLAAIRVSAENETRNRARGLLAGAGGKN